MHYWLVCTNGSHQFCCSHQSNRGLSKPCEDPFFNSCISAFPPHVVKKKWMVWMPISWLLILCSCLYMPLFKMKFLSAARGNQGACCKHQWGPGEGQLLHLCQALAVKEGYGEASWQSTLELRTWKMLTRRRISKGAWQSLQLSSPLVIFNMYLLC